MAGDRGVVTPPIRREGLVAINYYSVLARELAALHPMDGR